MQVLKLNTSPMKTNTYIVLNGDRAFVVDPGGEPQKIAATLAENNAKPEAILITHAHFDHIGGVAELAAIAPQSDERKVAVFMHKADCDKISSFKNMGFVCGIKVPPFVPDILLEGGETLTLAGLKVAVIHTPGHSAGGVCYKIGDAVFCGDTLFKCSYGRTDFYDGSFKELKNSIVNGLFNLKHEDCVLYPGHGEFTSLSYERNYNPILCEYGGDKERSAD